MPHPDASKHGLFGAVVGALLFLQPRSVQAQDAVELSWEAPAECPQRDAVQARIRELAGPALQNAERLRAEGRVVQLDGRYRLTLIVRDKGESRERTMDSHSCVDLAGAAAVALGLFIRQAPSSGSRGAAGAAAGAGAGSETGSGARAGGENAAGPEKPPARPGESGDRSTKPGAPEGDEANPEASEALRPEYTDATLDTDVHTPGEVNASFIFRAPVVALDIGPLPKPALGVGGGFGVLSEGWRFSAGGRIVMDQTWLIPGATDVGADVSRWQLELLLCRGWRFGRFELSPCLSLGVDRVSAEGTGPGVSAQSQDSISLVPGVAGTAHIYLSNWVAVFASLGFGIETTRPHLVVDGLGEIGQVGPVQVSLGLGPEWIF